MTRYIDAVNAADAKRRDRKFSLKRSARMPIVKALLERIESRTLSTDIASKSP
jgi:hypothetical protein